LLYGQCLAASNDPGTRGKVGKLAVALIHLVLLILARPAADLGVSKVVPGQKRRNYLNKATATLIERMMGKHVAFRLLTLKQT
jgi:hypothetical protein